MFDVFYSGTKPNVFVHEQEADSIEHAQKLSRTRYFWWINYLTDYSSWDFLWEPVPWQRHQRHAWGSQWQKDAGTYLVPKSGYTETNYRKDAVLTRLPDAANWQGTGIDQSWHPDPTEPPLIHQFGTQWQKTGGPRYTVPGAVDIKYEPQPRVDKTNVDSCWTVPDGVDTSTFDWTWHPDDTDPPYRYQFGTQHQRTGGPVYTVPGATEIKFVDQIRAKVNSNATAVYEINHMCGNAGQIPNTARVVRYFDNYRDTLIRLAKSIGSQHEFVWVCSSICDYTGFDFSWHPEQWQATMLHVFRSNDQKFGDTFFMHVPTFAARAEKKELLEWYDINFVDISVPRNAMPVIVHSGDSQVDAVKNTEWAGPLAVFTNYDYIPGNVFNHVPLWREETKTIVPISDGAGTVVVPRTAVPYIRTQLYDYPYIDRTLRMLKDSVLDIVFMSNGENEADYLYQRLVDSVGDRALVNGSNRIKRVDNVKGRVNSQHAAAQASTTSWYFVVWGKLEINQQFDWSWQPDRMQQPKHYIFHAYNPVNGLTYGHQAMIAYNKKLVLETEGNGLDFTMEKLHEVVPILSGTANYHTDDWMCWRTAFREVLKLKANLPDVESEYRLNKWLTVDSTPGQWSRQGAEDGVEYYDEVRGDFAALKKSYEWDWLASYAFMKRNLVP
jgi:hypothetical protein